MIDAMTSFDRFMAVYLIPVGWKVLGAIVLWIVGSWVIRIIGNLSGRGMRAQKLDPTLIKYFDATIRVILKIVLVIAILSIFGIQTTSFVALIAAAGIAIGAAWGGLLANFAAGAFLIILRPFHVGDMISAAGVTGDVKEIGLFATTIDTVDNLRIVVGNNKILSDNIVNYTTNPFRRVDLKAQLAQGVDPHEAARLLMERVKKVPNVIDSPAPSVEILEFNLAGPVLAVRPFCHNNNYWQVFFDTNKAIQETCAAAGYPAPWTNQVIYHKPMEG
ncbi:MAG TPA: mechanosensitive ion channel family protein [Syntrophorhabdaceae bacterium]|nr:mechanosensitive ion channel family protein [Syntrophorhabdaceae bacterium]